MEVHLAQRVRRVVHVHQLAARLQAHRGFIQSGDDAIAHVLLPIADGVPTWRRRFSGILDGARLLIRGLQQQRGEEWNEH